ncbi:MAG: ABC transporter permease [Acidobacteria bacterium]|nr:ABC transporter permease [Acidobacteriota bacterium]
MRKRLREIIKKELYQALREPRMRVLLFLPPLVQLIIFGFAVNLDVERSRIAWMDFDQTPESRRLLAAFEGSRYFQVIATPVGQDQVQQLLDREQVQAAVAILPGFARDIRRGSPAGVQILVSGTNSNTASVVSNYATEVVARYAGQVLEEQQRARLAGRTGLSADVARTNLPLLVPRSRVWFNPELRSRNYYVPGVIANIIAVVTLILTAMAIVREKEIGTMEQLMVTPIRPIELILGKTLPFALVGLLDMALVTVVALFLFHIPFRGAGPMLLGCSILYLLTTLGAGLFISTISQTQQQAMMASFFFFMPAFMLSGFAFPIRNMPVPVQYLTYANPVRYFIEILRGIFLKGSGPAVLWPQMFALLIFGVVVLGLSAARFQKRLD